jgi:hypothetical protein
MFEETVKCRLCEQIKDVREFPHQNGKLRRRTCWNCRGKRDRARLKLEMLTNLGSDCACCGENNPRFLTLDHVNNDGSKFREQYNEQQIYRLARRDGWPKSHYQVLCMNCNFAKGHFGECPHKLGQTTEMVMTELQNHARGLMREYGPLTEDQKVGLQHGWKISHVYGRAGKPKVTDA